MTVFHDFEHEPSAEGVEAPALEIPAPVPPPPSAPLVIVQKSSAPWRSPLLLPALVLLATAVVAAVCVWPEQIRDFGTALPTSLAAVTAKEVEPSLPPLVVQIQQAPSSKDEPVVEAPESATTPEREPDPSPTEEAVVDAPAVAVEEPTLEMPVLEPPSQAADTGP